MRYKCLHVFIALVLVSSSSAFAQTLSQLAQKNKKFKKEFCKL
jgi:hypothetical protein